MPLLRERRRIAPKKEILNIHETSRWTLQEKKKLLIALRKLHPNNTEQIQSDYLPHRTEKEEIGNKVERRTEWKIGSPGVGIDLTELEGDYCISWFIERMKSKVYPMYCIPRLRAYLELMETIIKQMFFISDLEGKPDISRPRVPIEGKDPHARKRKMKSLDLEPLDVGGKAQLDEEKKQRNRLWEKLAEELTCHDTDHSYALSEVKWLANGEAQGEIKKDERNITVIIRGNLCITLKHIKIRVFRKIAEEEEHFPKNLPENPDWKMIYLYFSALLNGDEPPEVGQIEAAVLLDLTEALAKQLKMLDLTEQQLVMIRKYNCLAERINAKSSEEYLELTKKGLDEDPSNSADQSNKPTASSESTPSGSQTEQGNKAPIVIEPLASTSQAPASAKKFVVGERFSGLHSRTQKRGRKKKTPSAPLPLSSLQKTALYSINPFCIPIRYLNPKVKPPPSPEIPSNAASNEGSSEAAQT